MHRLLQQAFCGTDCSSAARLIPQRPVHEKQTPYTEGEALSATQSSYDKSSLCAAKRLEPKAFARPERIWNIIANAETHRHAQKDKCFNK